MVWVLARLQETLQQRRSATQAEDEAMTKAAEQKRMMPESFDGMISGLPIHLAVQDMQLRAVQRPC